MSKVAGINELKTTTEILSTVVSIELKKAALAQATFIGQTATVEMGRSVGLCTIVTTAKNSSIVYTKKVGAAGYSRFVKRRKPIPTSKISLIITRTGDHLAFFGELAPAAPWDEWALLKTGNREAARKVSETFWANHAFLWGSQSVEAETRFSVSARDRSRGYGQGQRKDKKIIFSQLGDNNKILSSAYNLARANYPQRHPAYWAAFANSLFTYMTSWAGGYGGPSVREHTAGKQIRRMKYSWNAATEMLLDPNGLVFGPITESHVRCVRGEKCFDDVPGDWDEIKKFWR
ncbi:hypothetical protein HN954_00315 [bacterium]|nr:hypothetical protein [bacterium]MBT6832077.1 hypothetical protein [bacterium]MBT6995858.1 hypothetical protein [bacterium]MBT7772617.1 hypothetical protein [bacterium]